VNFKANVPDQVKGGRCQFRGRYSSPVDQAGCSIELAVGCSHTNAIDISSTCLEKLGMQTNAKQYIYFAYKNI